MAEEEQIIKAPEKKDGWFKKIPTSVLLSPGGMVLVFFALIMEIIDFFVQVPVVEEVIMLPLNIIFCFCLVAIAKLPVKSLVIPFFIERIPVISSILPTWLIRMFI